MAIEAQRPETTTEEQTDPAEEASSPSWCRIDVARYVAEMERTLCAEDDPIARLRALTILRRWQFDEMLDETSRQRARLLVLRFAA